MKNIVALDIETTGLDFNRDQITVVGVWNENGGEVFRDLWDLQEYIDAHVRMGYGFIGHNFKFDLKFLWRNGVDLPITAWVGDTELMSGASLVKPSPDYLERYEEKRREENKKLPKGVSHRKAGKHRLKVLAPYWLKVKPFWENPAEHDNDEYVLKDCEYTYELYKKLNEKLGEDELKFYDSKLMRWAKMLVRAEYAGIALDLDRLEELKQQSAIAAARSKLKLDAMWADHYKTWRDKEAAKLKESSDKRRDAYIAKLKDKSKAPNAKARYDASLQKKIEELPAFNLDSPTQLLWLLKTQCKYNVKTVDTGDESTDKSVLQSLAAQGHEDIAALLEYREHRKLATSFFPTYKELAYKGRIHPNFRITGTRTGRLSCSDPNLQQVPSGLHEIFVSDPDGLLATFDESAVEARLIAEYSCDETLIMICNKDWSIHDYNTKEIFFEGEIHCDINEVKKRYPAERAVSKTVGFALFYGAGWRRIMFAALSAGYVWSEKKCKAILARFKEKYAGAFIFKREILDPVLERGEYVLNFMGRPVSIPEKKDVYMKGFNTLIQSSASDMVVESATRTLEEIDRRGINGGVRILVHDEIVTQIPSGREGDEVLDIIKQSMVNYNTNYVNFEVEGGAHKAWVK